MPDGSNDPDPYDFAADPPAAIAAQRVNVPATPGKPVQLNYLAPKEDRPASAQPDAIKNVYIPLGLLGGGVVVEILATVIWNHTGFQGALHEVGVDLIYGTAVMLAGILLAAKLRKIDLGNFGQAVYKLAAISVAPTAIMEFIAPVLYWFPFGFLIVWVVQFVLYFAMLGALFDLDESDTWFAVSTIFLVRIAVYFGMKGVGWA